MSEIVELPLQTRDAFFQPSTVNVEARTVELRWTTAGAVVRRKDFFGEAWDEDLSLDEGSVRMGRLNSGASLLDSHQSQGLASVLGVVEKAWFEGKGKERSGRAKVRFSERANVEPIFRDVKDGIIRNVSVGYITHRAVPVERSGTKIPLVRIVDWEPVELSMVAVPADAGAQVRSAERRFPCVIQRTPPMADQPTPEAAREAADPRQLDAKNDNPNSEKQTEKKANGHDRDDDRRDQQDHTSRNEMVVYREPPLPVVTEEEILARIDAAIAAENTRIAQIRQSARILGLEEGIAERLIQKKTPLGTALVEMNDEAAHRQDARDAIKLGTSSVRITSGAQDEETTRREAIACALLHRSNPKAFPLTDAAREYRGKRLMELGRDDAERRGYNTRGCSQTEIAGMALSRPEVQTRLGYHTTSDFPNILADVLSKSLRAAYEAAPRSFTVIGRQATLPDFKLTRRLQLGEGPALLRINEHGEFTRGTIGESLESYALIDYGRVFAVTRKVLINDDLEALTRVPALFGESAARLESDVFWGIFLSNAAMGDGTALFHANHGNLIASASGPPTVATVGAARALMSKQVGLDGTSLISITPQYLIVPVELEVAAQQLVAGITPAQTSNVVPAMISSLTVIAEPRLSVGVIIDGTLVAGSAVKWYMSASPGRIDTVEYAYLEGQEGVAIDSRLGFDIDGLEIRARLDFGAKAIDWRGLMRSDGVP